MVETKKVSKAIPSDVSAIKFLLTNVDPENWKNLQNSQLSGPGGGDIPLKGIRIIGVDAPDREEEVAEEPAEPETMEARLS